MSEKNGFSSTYEPESIIETGSRWLVHLKETASNDEEIEYGREMVYELQYTLEPLCDIVEISKVRAEHVALYYVVTHGILATGRWVELTSRVRDDHAGPTYDKELYKVYLDNKLVLMRRFFAFCWAQGYICHDFLRWSWRPEDFVRLAKHTRTEPFLVDPSGVKRT